jgi:hypothetical protein
MSATIKSEILMIDSSENGVVCPRENELSREEAVQDDFRIDYLSSYADTIAQKISEGVPVKSYLMWAWTDNFECKSRTWVSSINALYSTISPSPGHENTEADKLQGKKDSLLDSELFGSIIKMDVNDTQNNRLGI